MERYERTVKKRVKWMMRERIMMAVLMKSTCIPGGGGQDSADADVDEDGDYIS